MKLNENTKTPFFEWRRGECSKHIFFPWQDVFESYYIGAELPEKVLKKEDYKLCPKCYKKPSKQNKLLPIVWSEDKIKDLVWVHFRSPDWTWSRMCGREGYISICLKHKMQVQFIMTKMN